MASSVDNLLPLIRDGSIGIEIGVAQGHSSVALLQHGVRFLYLIDPWMPYPEDTRTEAHEANYKEAMDNLATYVGNFPGAPVRYTPLRMHSVDAARHIPNGLIDFVWIDGDHRYQWVKSDCDLYWPKVKSGGILCGHDYCNSPPHCQVKDAVDQFAMENGLTVVDYAPCWVINKG